MQSNLIIKNTVKQRPLSPVNYYVHACKTQNQNIRLNMGLMSLEGGLSKIRHTKSTFDSSLKLLHAIHLILF